MRSTVGWHAAQLGDYDTAHHHCTQALALQRRHHDRDGEAHTLDSLGYIDHHTGNHHQAIRHYRQALTLLRSLGHTTETANTLDVLGHPHAALGHHAQARAVWQEALELYRDQGRDTDAERVRRHLDDTRRQPFQRPGTLPAGLSSKPDELGGQAVQSRRRVTPTSCRRAAVRAA